MAIFSIGISTLDDADSFITIKCTLTNSISKLPNYWSIYDCAYFMEHFIGFGMMTLKRVVNTTLPSHSFDRGGGGGDGKKIYTLIPTEFYIQVMMVKIQIHVVADTYHASHQIPRDVIQYPKGIWIRLYLRSTFWTPHFPSFPWI